MEHRKQDVEELLEYLQNIDGLFTQEDSIVAQRVNGHKIIVTPNVEGESTYTIEPNSPQPTRMNNPVVSPYEYYCAHCGSSYRPKNGHVSSSGGKQNAVIKHFAQIATCDSIRRNLGENVINKRLESREYSEYKEPIIPSD